MQQTIDMGCFLWLLHIITLLFQCANEIIHLFITQLLVRLSSTKKICFICFNKNRLKVMKNTFNFLLKVFSLSRYLIFCLDFLVM